MRRPGVSGRLGEGARITPPGIDLMLRLGAIFIAVCMVLIAASLGAVLYLAVGLDAGMSAVAASAALAAMILYNAISGRLRDRSHLGDRIAGLSRGTADLASQVGDMARRLAALESKTGIPATVTRDRLPAEIGELGGLVRQLAEMVALHEAALQEQGLLPVAALPKIETMPAPASEPAPAGMRGLPQVDAAALIAKAIEDNRVDLYLQPIVTLPQRKVRYYEAVARLRMEDGEVVPAEEFIAAAERAGLLPRLDNMMLSRCVQVTRRLQLKNRDVGVICNVGGLTLSDAGEFKVLLDFMEANRALAPALTLEFKQDAYRNFGSIERERLAAVIDLGYRLSMDHVADLRMEPKDLAERCFRFLKIPATLLLDKATVNGSDIHPEDFANLLARSGVYLVAERVESEATVADLLDYDVRLGQGTLFSAPRPVRAEALQVLTNETAAPVPEAPPALAVAAR